MKAKGFTPIKLAQDQELSEYIEPSQTVEIREIKNIITHHFDAIEDPRIERTKKLYDVQSPILL